MRLKILSLLALIGAIYFLYKPETRIDFNTQVKPLLNRKCMRCHGGVKQNGDFSLLTREEALKPTKNGKLAIVPGHPEASEMISRLHCSDPDERMPKHEAPLSDEEVALLTNWIKQGAVWGIHWAYQPVQQPDLPQIGSRFFKKSSAQPWGKNEIDAFVLDRLQQEKLQPAPEADRSTLLRRVSLDLIGMPAPEALANAFLQDSTEKGYEHLVDSLLASPQFGERWASVWLDLARYADSKGYERDAERLAWRYRDWLIRALNDDMPYDRFLTEQLAGDLLPNPSNAQLVATQFHRNTPTNDEGGTDNEEFRVAALLDRVNNTWEGLMGTTFGCVQCHSHPYDPFFHEEYYQFAAFFNNNRDADTYEDYPLLRHFAGADSLNLLALRRWLEQNANPLETERMLTLARLWQPAWYSLECDQLQNSALLDTKWLGMSHQSSARLPGISLDGKSRLLLRYSTGEKGASVQIHLDKPDGPVLLSIPNRAKTEGWAVEKIDFQPVSGKHDLYITYQNKALARKPEAFGIQFDWFAFTTEFPGKGKPGFAEQEQIWLDLLKRGVATNPVMWENPEGYRRETHVFERGNWLVHGQQVQPGTPRYLPAFPKDAPANRLGLAQWLCAPTHPLTSRVMVNRLWEQLFGVGLVETLEDFGSQGIEPTHPELLDWLAWRFMHDNQWSIKKMLRDMVLSATYRQSSELSAELLARDPGNRLLVRGPRVRLSAEQIRDQTLVISGLYSPKMYGPPVMPFQPEGIWNTPWNDAYWKTSAAENRYRRAVYTFWKRSSPYPSMITFDGAARQVCTARRVRTNTPLQALVTLNDPVFVEAAIHLATRMQQTQTSPSGQIQAAYALACGKTLQGQRQQILENLYKTACSKYQNDAAATKTFLKDIPEAAQKPEIAALAVVANAILNLDEVITKQ